MCWSCILVFGETTESILDFTSASDFDDFMTSAVPESDSLDEMWGPNDGMYLQYSLFLLQWKELHVDDGHSICSENDMKDLTVIVNYKIQTNLL